MVIRRFFKASLILALAGLVVASAGVIYLRATFTAPGPLTEDTVIVVPRGASLNSTADQLASAGVIASGDVFRFYIRFGGNAGDMRAGEFLIPATASMSDVLSIILRGDMVQRRATIPEGMTSRQIVTVINSADGLEGEIMEIPDEGALLPETYFYSLWDDRNALVARMKTRRDSLLYELWADRPADSPLLGPEDAVILASIVEKETGVGSERARVAGVYLNRLKQGMRLQSDPTVIYGITGGEHLGRAITRADLDGDTPYNTYRIQGLPPGAIANPGAEALRAVIHPAPGDDLYFVADGTGGHVFAETLAEHNRNVARWRRIEKERASGRSK